MLSICRWKAGCESFGEQSNDGGDGENRVFYCYFYFLMKWRKYDIKVFILLSFMNFKHPVLSLTYID